MHCDLLLFSLLNRRLVFEAGYSALSGRFGGAYSPYVPGFVERDGEREGPGFYG